MSQPASIHMGHGQMVDIVARGADQWEIVFSEAGVAQYKAPPVAEVKVEAIDADGAVHPLKIAAGGASSVMAGGHVAGARRARVMVVHGDHFHTRESLLPGAAAVVPQAGPQGGALARFGAAAVEVILSAPDTFELSFYSDGAAAGPPPPDSVVMQAIGPRAEDYQIRNLEIRAGARPGTLIASGKIKDAVFLRLTLNNGSGAELRSVPVIR